MYDPDRFQELTPEDQQIMASLGRVASFSVEKVQNATSRDLSIMGELHICYRLDFDHFANTVLWIGNERLA